MSALHAGPSSLLRIAVCQVLALAGFGLFMLVMRCHVQGQSVQPQPAAKAMKAAIFVAAAQNQSEEPPPKAASPATPQPPPTEQPRVLEHFKPSAGPEEAQPPPARLVETVSVPGEEPMHESGDLAQTKPFTSKQSAPPEKFMPPVSAPKEQAPAKEPPALEPPPDQPRELAPEPAPVAKAEAAPKQEPPQSEQPRVTVRSPTDLPMVNVTKQPTPVPSEPKQARASAPPAAEKQAATAAAPAPQKQSAKAEQPPAPPKEMPLDYLTEFRNMREFHSFLDTLPRTPDPDARTMCLIRIEGLPQTVAEMNRLFESYHMDPFLFNPGKFNYLITIDLTLLRDEAAIRDRIAMLGRYLREEQPNPAYATLRGAFIDRARANATIRKAIGDETEFGRMELGLASADLTRFLRRLEQDTARQLTELTGGTVNVQDISRIDCRFCPVNGAMVLMPVRAYVGADATRAPISLSQKG